MPRQPYFPVDVGRSAKFAILLILLGERRGEEEEEEESTSLSVNEGVCVVARSAGRQLIFKLNLCMQPPSVAGKTKGSVLETDSVVFYD